MIKRTALGIVLFLLCNICWGQLRSPDRAALKSLAKKRWDKAKQKLDRSLEKDSLNAASNFIYSQYYFNSLNPAFNIDSAYLFVNKALKNFEVAPEKERVRLQRGAVDSVEMIVLRKKIDSAAFERAKAVNTEGAFLHFLTNFPESGQRQEAMFLRDEAAYLDAVKANTYESFLRFLEKYPSATRVQEARNTYERLLYASRTKDRTLASYEGFLSQYPATPYRREVENHIFEISTASGDTEDFINFLKRYPKSSASGKARNILFHLLRQREEQFSEPLLVTDSLQNIQMLAHGFWVPILKDGKFGFMNQFGEVVIRPSLTVIHPNYTCGNIIDDVLIVNHMLMSRDGRIITRDTVEDIEDLGYGFLSVQVDGCSRVLHKSGFYINDCVDEGKVVAGKFIAVRKNQHWALYTLTGRSLTFFEWDQIEAINDVLLLKKGGKYKLAMARTIGASANAASVVFPVYDDVKLLSSDRMLVKIEDMRAVIDNQLKIIIGFDRQELKVTGLGILSQTPSGDKLYRADGQPLVVGKKIVIQEPWIAMLEDRWKIFDPQGRLISTKGYDSVRFEGPFAIANDADSVMIHFNASVQLPFPRTISTSFIPGKDSTAFLLIQAEKKKSMYDQSGVKLFSIDHDQVQYAGKGLFIVSKKNKKGLINTQGKVLVPAEYDAIGSVVGNMVSLLKNMKFGAYHVGLNKLIKPQYEKNLIGYTANRLTAFQKGSWAFIDWNNKPVSNFEFDEVKHWNDSTALVRKNFNWHIYNIFLKRNVEGPFNRLEYLMDSENDKLAIVKQDNTFGVISSKHGVIIPPTFTNVLNLGTAEEPLYFTEKHVEEASIYVVIYYDSNGKMLYRQVYEEDDYDRIFCSDN